MGRAGKWLRSFLPGRRGGGRDKAGGPDLQALALAGTGTPASTPGAKEKRRWSFRRPAASPPANVKDAAAAPRGPLSPYADPDQHAVAVAIATAAAAEAAVAAKQAAAAVVRLSASKRVVGIDEAAAIKIQAVFRSYLARKALCALRGLVKLQALVRGNLVRRQASHTLRCMQALVAAQDRARAARLRMLEDEQRQLRALEDDDDDDDRHFFRTTPTRRGSPSPHRRHLHTTRSSRHHHQLVQDAAEENVKIVEVDTGGEAYGTPRTAAASRRSSCYATPLCRTPSKNEMYQKVSPTPSALTDASARTYSGRYDDFSFATAARASPCRHAARGHHDGGAGAADKAEHPLLAVVPSYMANTESSRAKARSQSAPRQRLSVSSAEAGAGAGAWERQQPMPGPGGGRRRASLEAQATPRGLAPSRYGSVRVQRCPSQASAPAACPWGARLPLDPWSASAHDSECGSTSTVMTAATTTYCWSLATDNTGVA
ncbi:hypothetical protein U9M48_009972 [Paspalum notatum var. saurae]|uniref:DUF4005 domain-containing protein n=1 Tax=Paspalum notatum var. saurae TaxID=547442 RepID=A0AAQ3SS50_PASNO